MLSDTCMGNESSQRIGKIDISVEHSEAVEFFNFESSITALLVEDDSPETFT